MSTTDHIIHPDTVEVTVDSLLMIHCWCDLIFNISGELQIWAYTLVVPKVKP